MQVGTIGKTNFSVLSQDDRGCIFSYQNVTHSPAEKLYEILKIISKTNVDGLCGGLWSAPQEWLVSTMWFILWNFMKISMEKSKFLSIYRHNTFSRKLVCVIRVNAQVNVYCPRIKDGHYARKKTQRNLKVIVYKIFNQVSIQTLHQWTRLFSIISSGPHACPDSEYWSAVCQREAFTAMLEVSVPGRYPRKIYQVRTDQEARPKPKRKVSWPPDCIWLNPYYVRTVVSTVHGELLAN